jgi:hypothetical protein
MPGNAVSFDYPKGIPFRCTKCAFCCGDTKTRVRHILLLKKEAERMSEIISKPIEEFATKIEGHEPYVYEMRKTAGEGKCVFLEEKTCTIYELRPLICRFYPFQLETARGKKYKFFCTKECLGIGKGRQLGENYFEDLFQQACEQLKESAARD